MNQMYEILMGLPLFKGVSHDKISEIVEKAKFHFLKYDEGSVIINAHEPCTHIKFIISGSVRSSIANDNGKFKVSETLHAPCVIAPEFLFGKAQRYPNSVVANEATGVLQISKNDYMKILNTNEIFLFNFLNTLSMNAQKAVEGLIAVTSGGTLEERIAFWIISLTQRGGENITMECKSRDLYSLFGVQRTSLMAALNGLRDRGIIDYDNHEIRIVSRDALMEILSTPHDELI
jgi:CRP-like cAMP-binding protein